jgi:hypothetical protein
MRCWLTAGQLDDDVGRNAAHGYSGDHREDQRESTIALAEPHVSNALGCVTVSSLRIGSTQGFHDRRPAVVRYCCKLDRLGDGSLGCGWKHGCADAVQSDVPGELQDSHRMEWMPRGSRRRGEGKCEHKVARGNRFLKEGKATDQVVERRALRICQ